MRLPLLGRLKRKFDSLASVVSKQHEEQLLITGKILSNDVRRCQQVTSLSQVEFKVFSQFGDDGIIQWLVSTVDFPNKTFIEFGVSDYQESNTRFLLQNDNWSGFVMDGSAENINRIKQSGYYWKHELIARNAFINKRNVNGLIEEAGFCSDVGILHIDLDGNDYWIWDEITTIHPVVVILEYNSVLGIDRPITVPYDENFYRERAHFSNLYYGASLSALHRLSLQKGYSFLGCNTAGNNAYFVRNDWLNETLNKVKVSLEEGYVVSKFRESRNAAGGLSHLAGKERAACIKGLPVYNVEDKKIEAF